MFIGMKRIAFIFFAHFWAVSLLAQGEPVATTMVSSNLKIAYNGSIVYPGLRCGLEFPIRQTDLKAILKNNAWKNVSKKRYATLELGYYHHPSFHDNVFLLLGWQTRNQRPKGFFTEFASALGYSRTFLGGETYLVDNNTGKIGRVHQAGYNYAVLALGGGLGYAFRHKSALYLRTSLLTMFPSINIIYPRPTVDLGVVWQPKHFLTTRLKVVSKLKTKKP
jgi:hypothetical protein